MRGTGLLVDEERQSRGKLRKVLMPRAGRNGRTTVHSALDGCKRGNDRCLRVYDATGFFICSMVHREVCTSAVSNRFGKKLGASRMRFLGCPTF